ncbi:MAG: ABC transporter ATP-binding protein [Zoogloeaceae bacterium]|jgi:peptide/nickel transport system ATP-binding protein|nr:ABC transporter ATP-binding protein [Zoogloeaceae bacterium]
MSTPLLNVTDLSLAISGGKLAPELPAVEGLTLTLHAGETLALVGESGCGKSLTALALMRLLPPAVRVASGAVRLRGENLLHLPEAAMRTRRGREMAMIFQEPATSLNPVLTVGQQIGEALARRGIRGRAAQEAAAELLRQVGIAEPARRLGEYPFQLSGGMKQRVMIAAALAGAPEILIADEPTTALDVTVQSQILDLLLSLQAERGMAMLLITHDLGVVARMAHRVGVMYAGQLVETASRDRFFSAPGHPYSQALFAALPEAAQGRQRLFALPGQVPALAAMPDACRFAGRCARVQAVCREQAPPWLENDAHGAGIRCHFPGVGVEQTHAEEVSAAARSAATDTPLLRLEGLVVHFPIRKGLLQRAREVVRAVDGVSLTLSPGKTLALVGESGCGKSTAGRALLRLVPWTSGKLFWAGKQAPLHDAKRWRDLRRQMQMVFQDPFASLNPRLTVGEILLEGMVALGVTASLREGRPALEKLLAQVGLAAEVMARYPHEFSGGQRQRIAIARALAVSPQVLICDEPTSALDVSVQAQILNLLKDLQAELGLACLFITHNFAVVRYLAHEIAVMYLGRVVERGEAGKVLAAPAHPYTQALLSAVPTLDGKGNVIIRLKGEPPSPIQPPSGCHFHPRCSRVRPECRGRSPEVRCFSDGRWVACHFAGLEE